MWTLRRGGDLALWSTSGNDDWFSQWQGLDGGLSSEGAVVADATGISVLARCLDDARWM